MTSTKDIRDILSSIKDEKISEIDVNDRVLIVDSLNQFIRSFTMIQHTNVSGNHIGGLTGFLRTLAFSIRFLNPTRVILVFDGAGSSTNKKYIYPEYKANRNLRRVTNWDIFDNLEEESSSITNQILRLVDYLKCLPVDLLSVDKIEADDVIGYISQKLPGSVTIISSDRDFLQLVNNKISVYSPIKKKLYDKNLVQKEYGVTPINFLTQKILLGDTGDNVPGVRGLGLKTIVKLFPELTSDSLYTLEDVLDKCEKESKPKYKDILAFQHQLKINKLLMDLHSPNISENQILEIDEVLRNPNKNLDPLTFIRFYHEDSLGGSIQNLPQWISSNFNFLSKYDSIKKS